MQQVGQVCKCLYLARPLRQKQGPLPQLEYQPVARKPQGAPGSATQLQATNARSGPLDRAAASSSIVQASSSSLPSSALHSSSAGQSMQRGVAGQQSGTVRAAPSAQQGVRRSAVSSSRSSSRAVASSRVHAAAAPAAGSARPPLPAVVQQTGTMLAGDRAGASRVRQARCPRPTAPTRVQPHRAAKPCWI